MKHTVEIMTRLQKINMDYGSNSRAGWAGKTLRSASVPFDAIFESLDELFQSKVRPFAASNMHVQYKRLMAFTTKDSPLAHKLFTRVSGHGRYPAAGKLV